MNDNIDAILIDIAGVIHQSGQPIEGSVPALKKLQESGIPFRMLTNTTSKPHREIIQMLKSFGIDIPGDVAMTAPTATVGYLRQHHLRPHLIVADAIADEFANLVVTEPNCVVLGDAGEVFNYQVLNRAFRVLHRDPEAKLIAMGGNRFFRDRDGQDSLDILPFAACLSAAANREIIVTGKPSRTFFDSAVESVRAECDMPIQRDRVVMIGDDLENDVGGALDAGLQGVLVRTGKFDAGELSRSEVEPTAIHDDFASVVDSIMASQTTDKTTRA